MFLISAKIEVFLWLIEENDFYVDWLGLYDRHETLDTCLNKSVSSIVNGVSKKAALCHPIT